MHSVNRISTKMMRRCKRSSRKVGSNDCAGDAARQRRITMQIELNYPDPVPVKLEPAKTMLLIVDMENEDLHPTGKRYMGETAAQIIPSIAALRRRVRQAGGLVVHTQSVRKPDALEFTLFKNVVRKVEGTWGAEFVDELKPAGDEPVVVKYTHDCFYRTGMEALLERLGLRAG